VAPASFSFSGISAGPIKAGNNFGATITAQNSAGNATPNFGKESISEGVTITSNLITPNPVTFPSAANPGVGNNAIAGSSFSNGVATVGNLNWGEVGNITLSANLSNPDGYLGTPSAPTGLTATGTSATVGPFVPDHFDTTVSQVSGVPMPCPSSLTCPTLYNGIVYSGQVFTANVYARNAAGGTTRNYDGSFGLSKQVTLSAWNAPGSTTTQNPGGGALSSNTVPAASFTSGATTPLGTPATPIYTFGTVPTAPTDIYIRAADADATSSANEQGVKVVSGRIDISNANGSELLDLPINVTAQFWNGTSYVTSITDSVSSFTTASGGNLAFSNCHPLRPTMTALPYCPPATYPAPSSVVFTNGAASFTLAKPGSGNTGSVDLSVTGIPYLPSDAARATFGVYNSNSNFIYMQEQY
jgi:MSHA biogenesis protein MshQ